MLNENIIETVCSSKAALASGMLNLDSGIIWTIEFNNNLWYNNYIVF